MGSKVSSELGSDDPSDDGPSAAAARHGARLVGDEDELFRGFDRRFRRIVQHEVNTSPAIVNDACAFAWTEFMHYQPDRDRGWRAWLKLVERVEHDLRGALQRATVFTHLEPLEDPSSFADTELDRHAGDATRRG